MTTSPAQQRLDDAQTAFEQAHTTWEQAIVARRTAEQKARSQPTFVDAATGRLIEAQYAQPFLVTHRRLTAAEAEAWELRVAAGDAVVAARQEAAAEARRAAAIAAAQP